MINQLRHDAFVELVCPVEVVKVFYSAFAVNSEYPPCKPGGQLEQVFL